jgi:hypothetical protein
VKEPVVPYRFGAPVEPPWFCDRRAELELVTSRMLSGIHVTVLSPRRYGKTSLVLRAAAQARRHGVRTAYANLLVATNEAELAAVVLQAVLGAVLGPLGRRRHGLEESLRRLRVAPRLSVGPDGSVSVGLDPAAVGGSWLEAMGDAISLLERASGSRGGALVLDEFQVAASIGRGGVGGAFKALADAARRTCLVFCGSHQAVMEQLAGQRRAPLHGMGERLVLDVVPEEPMVAYLQRRAGASGKRMPKPVAKSIYALADGVPNSVQQLAQAALEAAGAQRLVSHAHVERGFATVVERRSVEFAQLYEDLASAPSQQRLLRALAHQPTSAVYARAFLDAVGVANANAVATALRALDGRGLLTRRARVWQVADPFLRRWLVEQAEGL